MSGRGPGDAQVGVFNQVLVELGPSDWRVTVQAIRKMQRQPGIGRQQISTFGPEIQHVTELFADQSRTGKLAQLHRVINPGGKSCASGDDIDLDLVIFGEGAQLVDERPADAQVTARIKPDIKDNLVDAHCLNFSDRAPAKVSQRRAIGRIARPVELQIEDSMVR